MEEDGFIVPKWNGVALQSKSAPCVVAYRLMPRDGQRSNSENVPNATGNCDEQ